MTTNLIISSLADILKTISYNNDTLGNQNLVKTFPDLEIEKYGCEVQVYCNDLFSGFSDSMSNRREYTIFIDILSHIADKQEQGMANLNELSEKVLEKLEKALPKLGSTVPNTNGLFIDNNSIKSSGLKIETGQAFRRFSIKIFEFPSTL